MPGFGVLGDMDGPADHLGADDRLLGDGWARLVLAGAQRDAGKPSQPDDRGSCGYTSSQSAHGDLLLAEVAEP
jgi:hypothetical protein